MTRAFAIYGFFGGWNAGDEIILESVVNALRARQPGCDIAVISSKFHQSSITAYEALGVTPIPLRSLDCVKELGDRELVIGGGQIMTGDVSVKGLVALLGLTTAARVRRSSTVLLCIGTQGIDRGRSRLLVAAILRNVQRVIARDEDAVASLRRCTRQPEQIELTADVVFNGMLRDRDRPPSTETPPSDDQVLLVLHWSSMRSIVESAASEQLLRALDEQLIDASIVVQSHDRRAAFDDGGVATLNALGNWGSRIEFRPFSDLDRLIEGYRSSEVIVSARMHPLIISTVLGKPCIALRGSAKTSALANKLNIPIVDPTDTAEVVAQIDKARSSAGADWTDLGHAVNVSLDDLFGTRKAKSAP